MSAPLTPRDRLIRQARARGRRVFWEMHNRDTYRCPCGRADGIEIHHRDGDWLNNNPINLVGLCHFCHCQTHHSIRQYRDLEQWKAGFLALGDS